MEENTKILVKAGIMSWLGKYLFVPHNSSICVRLFQVVAAFSFVDSIRAIYSSNQDYYKTR